MGPVLVVILQPDLGSVLGFGERVEQIGIKYFFPKTFVEPLDKRVLIRFSGLDKPQFNAVAFGPVGEVFGG